MIREREVAMALREARTVADHGSTCVRKKVGAVLFDANGEFLSYGINRTPVDLRCDAGHCPRGLLSYEELPVDSPYANCIADHAEVVALELGLERQRERYPDWTMLPDKFLLRRCVLVVTDEPCHECKPKLEKLDMDVYWPGGEWHPER